MAEPDRKMIPHDTSPGAYFRQDPHSVAISNAGMRI